MMFGQESLCEFVLLDFCCFFPVLLAEFQSFIDVLGVRQTAPRDTWLRSERDSVQGGKNTPNHRTHADWPCSQPLTVLAEVVLQYRHVLVHTLVCKVLALSRRHSDVEKESC